MDFSDRLRMTSKGSVAAAATPFFTGTWTNGVSTMTYVSGTTPILRANVVALGIPSNTVIREISGSTLILDKFTTAGQTALRVAMKPASASLIPYDSYDSKYTIEAGLSNLTYATGGLRQKALRTLPLGVSPIG